MARKLHTVADVQSVQKIIIRLRGTVALSRDYPEGEVNRTLVNSTIASWAEEMATALRTAEKPRKPAQLRPRSHA